MTPSCLPSVALVATAIIAFLVCTTTVGAIGDVYCEDQNDKLCPDDDEDPASSKGLREDSRSLGDGRNAMLENSPPAAQFLRITDARVEKAQGLKSVEGKVDGVLFPTSSGIDASLTFDYEDGTQCSINGYTKKRKIDFISGGKRVQLKWNNEGFKIYFVDDLLKNKKGKKVKKFMQPSFLIEMLTNAPGFGIFDPEMESLADCILEYVSLWRNPKASKNDGRRLFYNMYILTVLFAQIEAAITPLLDSLKKCGYSEKTFQAISIGSFCNMIADEVSTDCNAFVIQPAIAIILSTSMTWIEIFDQIARISDLFPVYCSNDAAAQSCLDEINYSCFSEAIAPYIES